MRLVGYVRVSTEEQASGGASLASQEYVIRQWAGAMDHEVVAVFQETASARTMRRPVFEQALTALDEADGLVVVKLDRLTRSVSDFCQLGERFERAGKVFVSVRDSYDTSTAAGRMFANILVSVAQFEREMVSERTKDALAQKRREGVRLGRPPAPLPDGVEDEIRKAHRWYGRSLRDLAAAYGVSVGVVRRVVR